MGITNCQKMIKSFVSMYHHVRINQLRRLATFYNMQDSFYDAIKQLKNAGEYSVKNNAVFLRQNDFSYTDNKRLNNMQITTGLEKAFVILTDFYTAVPLLVHFPTHKFPSVLVFATDAEIYELLYVEKGKERIAEAVMAEKDNHMPGDSADITKRIVIVDNEDQIPKIHNMNCVYSFAIVDEKSGQADYYPVSPAEERREDVPCAQ